MKREVLFAIIVGFSLGLVITFGIYRAQKSIQNATQDNNEEQETEVEIASDHVLTITQPNDGEIVDTDILSVSGVTTAGSLVSVVTNDDQVAVEADEFGNFSAQVEVSAGANEVIVSSFDKAGNQISKTLTVVFSTVDFDDEVESEE
jgi:hypothetical protein